MTQELAPLPYHHEIASRLEALEPRGWAVFARAARQAAAPAPRAAEGEELGAADDLEQQLLRHSYRMEAGAHPRVHAAAALAADALGITVPLTIYQLEAADRTNAALAYRPDEAVIALSGNLLTLLDDEELVACFGHELAHHRLWSEGDGRLLVADRFLGALSIDAATPPYYLETGRRLDLATELFADRGSLVACGSLDVAIACLVKVATGLSDVDPAAFLRQAKDARPDRGATGDTHPETVLRAWALDRWAAGEGDEAVRTLLAPALDIERLDLIDRERLEALTRRLVMDAVAPDWMQTDAIVGHARQFLVDVMPSGARRGWLGRSRGRPADAARTPVEVRVLEDVPTETRRYLAYVLLDLATVDADLDDEPLVECLAVAREAGLETAFEEVARKELILNARAWEGLRKRATGRRLAVAAETRTVAEQPAAEPPAAEPPAAEPSGDAAEPPAAEPPAAEPPGHAPEPEGRA